jgi:hypothetical protein
VPRTAGQDQASQRMRCGLTGSLHGKPLQNVVPMSGPE